MRYILLVLLGLVTATITAQTTPMPGPTKTGTFFKIAGDTEESIARAIGPGLYVKSEFESKDEYLKRLKTWNAKTLYPSGRPLNETVLIFSRGDIARYDPETRKFDISLGLSTFASLRDVEHPRMEMVRWSGYWERLTYLGFLEVNAEPNAAKLIKPLISVAVYGSPVTGDTTGEKIKFVPSRIVAFNRETDEIYAIRDLPDYFHEGGKGKTTQQEAPKLTNTISLPKLDEPVKILEKKDAPKRNEPSAQQAKKWTLIAMNKQGRFYYKEWTRLDNGDAEMWLKIVINDPKTFMSSLPARTKRLAAGLSYGMQFTTFHCDSQRMSTEKTTLYRRNGAVIYSDSFLFTQDQAVIEPDSTNRQIFDFFCNLAEP